MNIPIMYGAGKKPVKKNRDHQLHGDCEGYRECHITPNWLPALVTY